MLGLVAVEPLESPPKMSPHDVAPQTALRSRSVFAPADLKSVVRALCHAYSTEVTPSSAKKIGSFRDLLSPGTDVYITFLPGADYRDTVTLAVRLRREGYNPVPHIAARSIMDRASLDDYLARAVGDADVRHVLTIAGAPDKSCGEFADSMQLLSTGLFQKHGISRIAVAGHPESCNCCTEAASPFCRARRPCLKIDPVSGTCVASRSGSFTRVHSQNTIMAPMNNCVRC